MKPICNILIFVLYPIISISQGLAPDYWKQDYVKGSFLEAKTKINILLKEKPYLSHLIFYRGICNKNLQNYTESLSDINQYLQTNDNVYAQIEKGNVLLELGYNERAFKEFLDIKQKHGDLEQIKIPLARYFLYKNQPHEAKILIRELYNQYPNNHDLLWLLSLNCIQDGNTKDALIYLQNSIKNGLRNSQKLEEIYDYAKQNNQLELSLYALDECIKLTPKNPVYYYKKQSLLELLNKPLEAEKSMLKGNSLLSETTVSK